MTAKVEIINGNGVVEVDIDGQVSENVNIDAANIEVLETNVGGLSTIFGASDTNFNSLADKDALFYDVVTGKWINSIAYFEYIKTQNFVGLPVHMETLQQWIDHIYSSGRVHGLELTDNLDGTVDIATGVSIMRAVDDPHTALYSVNIDGVSDLALTDNQTNFIYAEYNAVAPTIGVTLNPGDINLTTKVPLFVVVREGVNISVYDVGEDSVDANAKLRQRFFYTEKFRRADGGAIIYDAGALHVGCSAGEFYFGLTSFTFDAFDTTGADTFEYYRLINGAWVETDESTVSNSEYNDISVSGSESLVSLGASKYAVHWVYLIGSTTNPHFAVIYSQDFYNNLAGAEAATVPSNIPPSIEGLGILLGRVIARQGDSEIITAQSSFTETFSSSLATSHNGLADLQGGVSGEYYHLTSSEYTGLQSGFLMLDGSKTMTGEIKTNTGTIASNVGSTLPSFVFNSSTAKTTGNHFEVKDNGRLVFSVSETSAAGGFSATVSAGGTGIAGGILDGIIFDNIGTAGNVKFINTIGDTATLSPVSMATTKTTFSIALGVDGLTVSAGSIYARSNEDLGKSGNEWGDFYLGGDIILDAVAGSKIGTATGQKIGFWNATPIVQPSSFGETVGFSAGTGTGVNDDSVFTGNIGSTAYRISDIVKALKQTGLMAS